MLLRGLILVVVLVSTSSAIVTNWQNASGGTWENATNWDNGVPTAVGNMRIVRFF
jgi:hypothetical protein